MLLATGFLGEAFEFASAELRSSRGCVMKAPPYESMGLDAESET